MHTLMALSTEHPPPLSSAGTREWGGGGFFHVSASLQGVAYPDMCSLHTPSEDPQAIVRIYSASTLRARALAVPVLWAVSRISTACEPLSLLAPSTLNLPSHAHLLPCWALGV